MSLTTLRQLYDLQELDWEIDQLHGQLASVESRLRDNGVLTKARAEAVELEGEIQQIRRQHTRQVQEVQQLQENVRLLEERLYGGSVRTPKELESLNMELVHAKDQSEQLEEGLLTLMIGLDESEELMTKGKDYLAHLEAAWVETRATLTTEQATLEEQVLHFNVKRQQITKDIPPELFGQYQKLRQSRQGYAVAKVERGMCLGCRLTLPTHELQRVRTAKDPVVCSSCGRILFMS